MLRQAFEEANRYHYLAKLNHSADCIGPGRIDNAVDNDVDSFVPLPVYDRLSDQKGLGIPQPALTQLEAPLLLLACLIFGTGTGGTVHLGEAPAIDIS